MHVNNALKRLVARKVTKIHVIDFDTEHNEVILDDDISF